MEYIFIIISAILVNNIVLAKFLGICPFVGVSAKTDTAVGMSGAVTFVMTIATIVTWLINEYILIKGAFLVQYNLEFLQTISFILVIASLVQLVELVLKKVSPPLYQALGIYLPLMTTNCAILGVAIEASGAAEFGLLHSVVFAISNAIGFGLVLILFASMREHMDLVNIPKGMRGIPAAMIVAGILALAFMGFAGLV
ncbi:MAG: RnfABCDGE type electron transport complex subunit A [Bacteroidales bacterium]